MISEVNTFTLRGISSFLFSERSLPSESWRSSRSPDKIRNCDAKCAQETRKIGNERWEAAPRTGHCSLWLVANFEPIRGKPKQKIPQIVWGWTLRCDWCEPLFAVSPKRRRTFSGPKTEKRALEQPLIWSAAIGEGLIRRVRVSDYSDWIHCYACHSSEQKSKFCEIILCGNFLLFVLSSAGFQYENCTGKSQGWLKNEETGPKISLQRFLFFRLLVFSRGRQQLKYY